MTSLELLDLYAECISSVWSDKKMYLRVRLVLASPGIGEGNGTPLQYCCPENPMDGEAW